MFLKICCLVVILSVSCTAKEFVKISLYFEGLCPGCHDFILNQLYPGYQKLGDNLLLDLIPFGNAWHTENNGQIEIECQHGPLECYINKLIACAIDVSSIQAEIMEFLHCVIKNSTYDNTQDVQEAIAIQCAGVSSISWGEIDTCITSKRADELELAYEDRENTLDPGLLYVPHIRFNDIYNDTLEDSAVKDLVGTACQLFKQKPKACEDINGKSNQ